MPQLAVEYENNAIIVKVDTDDEYEFARDMQVIFSFCHFNSFFVNLVYELWWICQAEILYCSLPRVKLRLWLISEIPSGFDLLYSIYRMSLWKYRLIVFFFATSHKPSPLLLFFLSDVKQHNLCFFGKIPTNFVFPRQNSKHVNINKRICVTGSRIANIVFHQSKPK